MTLSLVKNIASFKGSSDELMKYKVSKEKLRDQIVKLGIDGFMRKYAGQFIYGYNASQMTSLYSKDDKKTYKLLEDSPDSTGKVVISAGDYKFDSPTFTEIIKFLSRGDYYRYVNDNILTNPEGADITNLVVDATGNKHIDALYFRNAVPISNYAGSTEKVKFSLFEVNDMSEIFRSTTYNGGGGNELNDELHKPVVDKIRSLLSSINTAGISITNTSPTANDCFDLIELSTQTDIKKFDNLLTDKNQLVAFLRSRLPAFDGTINKAGMDRIVASISSADASYADLRKAILRASGNDGIYSSNMRYHNIFGFYNFVKELEGQSVDTASTARAIRTGDVEYVKLKTTDINFPAGPAGFNIKGNQLVSFFNNNLDRFPRNKDHLIKLTFNITSSGYTGPKVQIVTGGTGKKIVDLASARMLQKAIEKIDMVAPLSGSSTSVLEMEIPRIASLREDFYNKFASILKKTVKNSF